MTTKGFLRSKLKDSRMTDVITALCLSLLLTCTSSEDKGPHMKQASLDHDHSITFGSCSKIDLDQHLWDDILGHRSDYWIWLGDIIYADTEDMDLMGKQYRLQDSVDGYRRLKDSVNILGVWDDHDYGLNNGGKEYPMKAESRDILFDFLNISPDDVDRDHEGAYNETQIRLGPLSVHVILLDVRYFRDPISYRNGKPLPNLTGTILGKEQWQWLDSLLEKSSADLFLIGSGIQILPQDHDYEKWSNFPVERQRLLDLLNKTIKPVVLLSGDRHIGEISRIDLPGREQLVYEITSSSLTHTWKSADEYNRHRVGPLVRVDNFGAIDFKFSNDFCRIELNIISEGRQLEATENFSFPLP